MKRKLFLLLCALLTMIGVQAQTDVTSTYITNPSFESNGATIAEGTTAPTGWTYAYSKADKAVVSVWDNSTNATGYGKEVTPADGSYYSQIRIRWEDGINSGTLSNTATTLPSGLYKVSIDYKAASSNNTSGTTISLTAKNGSATLASANGTVLLSVTRDNTQTVFDDSHPWQTINVYFWIDEEASVKFEAKFAANQNSDAIFDNLRLVKYSGWEKASLSNNTKYLIKNVESGQYLGPANDWGTQASLIPNAHYNTIHTNGGAYTIESHVSNGGSNYYFTGSYMDGGATNMYIYKNNVSKYLITNGSGAWYGYGGSSILNSSLAPDDENALWEIVSYDEAIAALNTATTSAPLDATFLIRDANFDRNNRDASSWVRVGDGGNAGRAGDNANRNYQVWNAAVNFSQTISDIPNGVYKLQAQGFYRPGGNNTTSTEQNVNLFANDEQIPLVLVSSTHKTAADATNGFTTANTNETDTYYVPNSQSDASKAFSANNFGYYENIVNNINVTDNSIKVGIVSTKTVSDAWTVVDNFRLYYLGPNLIQSAVEFTTGSTTAANQWYYYVIPTNETYEFTSSETATLTYTTAGSQLTENAEGTPVDFSAGVKKDLELEQGRIYFKTDVATTLNVSYKYNVGTASANIAYIQPGQTVRVTFANVSTNNPGASLTQDYSTVTFGGETIQTTQIEEDGVYGFTFNVPDNVAVATDYSLAIPAGVIGYAVGETYNAETSFTLKTPAIFDGVYYMYNTDTENYISRAGRYNTQAIMDDWGLAFNISTDANNNTKLQYFDSQLWLGDDGFCFGDCSGTRVRTFNVTKVNGGYKFLNTNNRKYLAVYDGQAVGDAVEGSNLQGTSNVWALESTTAHVANYTRNADTQAAAAAAAAGLSSTTKAALDTEVSALTSSDITVTGSKAEKFQQYPGDGEHSGPLTYYTETISDLEPGLYKLSVSAFQRATSYDWLSNAGGARGLIYLYAGDAKTQIKSVMDQAANVAYSSDHAVDGKHYPDNETCAYEALTNLDYSNDVYVYVAPDEGKGTGSLEIGIKNPSRLGGNYKTWAAYDKWTLTRYYDATSVEHYYSISAVAGGNLLQVLASGTAEEGTNYTANAPKVIVKDGKYYVLDAEQTDESVTMTNFLVTCTMGDASVTNTVTYTLDESIVYFSEADDFNSAQKITSAEASGGYYSYYFNSPQNLHIKTAGEYQLEAKIVDRQSNSSVEVYPWNGTTSAAAIAKNSGLGVKTVNFTATDNMRVAGPYYSDKFQNSSSVDYIIVRKVSDAADIASYVGYLDKTTGENDAYSSSHTLKQGETMTLTFQNHGGGSTWGNNWRIEVNEDGVLKTRLRADSWDDATGAAPKTAYLMSKDGGETKIGLDWSPFEQDMVNANVTAQLTYGFDGKLSVTTESTGEANGYIYYVDQDVNSLTKDLEVKLTVSNSWLKIESVEYVVPVTFSPNGYATFACQRTIELPEDESVKAFTATADGTTVSFHKLTEKIPANTGVLLSGPTSESGEVVNLTVTEETASDVNDNLFEVGSGAIWDAEDVDNDTYYFALKKGAQGTGLNFGTFNPTSIYIAKNKAYLPIAKDAFTQGARLSFIFEGDNFTGINVINATETEVDVQKDGKFLENGKIVIVKNGVKYSANGQKLN